MEHIRKELKRLIDTVPADFGRDSRKKAAVTRWLGEASSLVELSTADPKSKDEFLEWVDRLTDADNSEVDGLRTKIVVRLERIHARMKPKTN